MNNNQDDFKDTGKKPDTFRQILIALGISAAAYAIIIGFTSLVRAGGLGLIVVFAVLAFSGVLIVKAFRRGYTAAAVTMLVLISPLIALLLLFGACALVMLPL